MAMVWWGGRRSLLPIWVCLVFLSACYLPASPQAGPVGGASPVPSSSPTATETPSATATPPPSLTPPLHAIDPAAVQANIAATEARLAQRGLQMVCLRQENVDLDEDLEWLGLYLLPADPPQLLGFVLDGNVWHDLAPPENEEYAGLGQYATCEMQVRDVNADGLVEIVIWGRADASTDYLHVFAFAGDHYALLGAFEGKGGIFLENTDGDLADEVVVRLRPQAGLVQEIVYTWDGSHYAWTWDRYNWFYLDRPHVYRSDTPERALISFYLALDDRDLPGAFALLSPGAQAAQAYEDWVDGFATTLQVEVGVVQLTGREGGQATVAAQVIAMDNVAGRVMATLYDVTWQLIETENGWRLASGEAAALEQWEVRYYP